MPHAASRPRSLGAPASSPGALTGCGSRASDRIAAHGGAFLPGASPVAHCHREGDAGMHRRTYRRRFPMEARQSPRIIQQLSGSRPSDAGRRHGTAPSRHTSSCSVWRWCHLVILQGAAMPGITAGSIGEARQGTPSAASARPCADKMPNRVICTARSPTQTSLWKHSLRWRSRTRPPRRHWTLTRLTPSCRISSLQSRQFHPPRDMTILCMSTISDWYCYGNAR